MKLLPIHLLGIAVVGGGALYVATKKPAPAPGSASLSAQLTPAQNAQLVAATQAQLAAFNQMAINAMGGGMSGAPAQTPQSSEQTDPTQTVSDLANQGQQAVDNVGNTFSSLFG
jgi:hypothetical protein